MNCGTFRKRCGELFDDGGLETGDELKAHLEGCESCREHYEALRRTAGLFARDVPMEVSEALTERIVQRAREEEDAQGDSARARGRYYARGRVLGSRYAWAGGLGLAVLALLVAIPLFMGAPELRAQVMEGLKKAQRLHITRTIERNGAATKAADIWADGEKGVVQHEYGGGEVRVWLDDGKYDWRYVQGEKRVARMKSMGYLRESFIEDFAQWTRFDPVREPAGDKIRGGETLQMYRFPKEGDRCLGWIDAQGRMVEVEEAKERAGNREVERHVVEYDVAIDPGLFSGEFGNDVQVAEPREMLEQRFPLEDALLTADLSGLTFAVHRVARCEGGVLMVVSSSRVQAGLRGAVGEIGSFTYLGQARLAGPLGTSPDGLVPYQLVTTCAEMKEGEMIVSYSMLAPQRNGKQPAKAIDLWVIASAANELETVVEGLGQKRHLNGRFRLELQDDGSVQGMDEAIDSIYGEVKYLEPMLHWGTLLTSNQDEADLKQVRKKPRESTLEEYRAGVNWIVERWLRNHTK